MADPQETLNAAGLEFYEEALRQLLAYIPQNHARHDEASGYARQLSEHLSSSRQQPEPPATRSQREQIISRLDQLSLAVVRISFRSLVSLLSRPLGRYQVSGIIGAGGMGVVLAAYDPQLERTVALKLVTELGQSRPDEIERFRREVRAVAQLSHPHIITIYDVDLAHQPPYLVMELLNGGSLADRLRSGPLPWTEALHLLRPLVQALAYAHRVGIIHRDLKPSNVMFQQPGPPDILKLVDFGLVRWQEQQETGLTQSRQLIGTPSYMSPEQARGDAVDIRSDIFSLGIILFEAMTGRNPLDKGSLYPTLAAVGSDEAVDTSALAGRVPPQVLQLIKQTIAKDLEQRYQRCEHLLADLDRCLDMPAAAPHVADNAPPVPTIITAGDIRLTPEISSVLRMMFRDFERIAVEAEYSRGLSGSRVYRVQPLDAQGIKHYLPTVVKVAPTPLIQQEWAAYESWVENKLPAIAHVDVPPLLAANQPWAGLRYSLVGGGAFSSQSLRDYYQQASPAELRNLLQNQVFKIMNHWWQANRVEQHLLRADYDNLLPINLLLSPIETPAGATAYTIDQEQTPSPAIKVGEQVRLRNFVVTEIDTDPPEITLNLPRPAQGLPAASARLRLSNGLDLRQYQLEKSVGHVSAVVKNTRQLMLVAQVKKVMGEDFDTAAERLTLPGGPDLPNPLLAYQELLQTFRPLRVSTIHGDFNLENIITTPNGVSLIDFATVRQGHVLHDLLRLETEVVTKLVSEVLARTQRAAGLIHSFYRQLHRVPVLGEAAAAAELPEADLAKPFSMLVTSRQTAREYLVDRNDWSEYYQGLVLYLLGALKFKNLDREASAPLPKQVAFWGAATVVSLLNNETPIKEGDVHVLDFTPPLNESKLSDFQRQILEQRRQELQEPLKMYSRRIIAVQKDLTRASDSEQEILLNERLTDLKQKRQEIETELEKIMQQLEG